MKALYTFGAEVPWSRVLADHRRWLWPVGLVLAINVVVLLAVVMPMRRAAESGSSQAAESTAALNVALADLKNAEATRDGQSQASRDLERFYSEVLPTSFASARRLTTLRLPQMARAHQVVFARGNTRQEVLRDSPIERLQTSCSLTGEWEDIRQLIYDIEVGPDFLVIDNMTLSEGGSATSFLSLQLEISTYYRVNGNAP